MVFEAYIFLAVALDFMIGDPRWFPHPVRFIGKLGAYLENFFRLCFKNAKFAGYATTFHVLFITLVVVFVILYIAGKFSPPLQTALSIVLIYFFIAVKDLLQHSKAVYNALEPNENIIKAREEVGKIVGRDTESLGREDICKACVETVAENLVDGITAPLFWAVIFSMIATVTTKYTAINLAAVGIVFYKTINTMDSMFGYKNDRYIDFGWLPARLDDLVNYIPARLTGMIIVAAAFITGLDWRKSFSTYVRDRFNHASPNAGHPEAAVAGALDVQLGGTSNYFGKKVEKPFMGEKSQEVTTKHILATNKLATVSSLIFLLLILLFRKMILLFYEYMANLLM